MYSRDFHIGLEMGWHQLTKVKEVITREDFPEVYSDPLKYGKDNTLLPGWRIPVSSDDQLPIGKPSNEESYSLFTPREAWDYVNEQLTGTAYRVTSIGMLKNRTIWYISTELDELNEVRISDNSSEHRLNLNFSGSLDRKISPQAEVNDTRIVCWNTLSLSRNTEEGRLFKIRATKNFRERLKQVEQEVQKAVGVARIYQETIERLVEQTVNPIDARNIYTGYMVPRSESPELELNTSKNPLSKRTENTIDSLMTLFQTGKGNRGETMLDLTNAFTELYTRGNGKKKSLSSQVSSSEFGLFADKKWEFFESVYNPQTRETLRQRGADILAATY